MGLWSRIRRVWLLVLVLALLSVVGVAMSQRTVALPAFFGSGTSSVSLRSFLPFPWSIAVADAFATRGQAVEARPARRMGWADAGLFVASVLAAALSFWAFDPTGGRELAAVAPVLILSGLSCVGTLRAGPASGALAVTVLLLVTTLYAMNAPGARFVRVLQPDGCGPWSLVIGALLCALACWLLLTNQVTTRLGATERLD
jgi:hypothetical protein